MKYVLGILLLGALSSASWQFAADERPSTVVSEEGTMEVDTVPRGGVSNRQQVDESFTDAEELNREIRIATKKVRQDTIRSISELSEKTGVKFIPVSSQMLDSQPFINRDTLKVRLIKKAANEVLLFDWGSHEHMIAIKKEESFSGISNNGKFFSTTKKAEGTDQMLTYSLYDFSGYKLFSVKGEPVRNPVCGEGYTTLVTDDGRLFEHDFYGINNGACHLSIREIQPTQIISFFDENLEFCSGTYFNPHNLFYDQKSGHFTAALVSGNGEPWTAFIEIDKQGNLKTKELLNQRFSIYRCGMEERVIEVANGYKLYFTKIESSPWNEKDTIGCVILNRSYQFVQFTKLPAKISDDCLTLVSTSSGEEVVIDSNGNFWQVTYSAEIPRLKLINENFNSPLRVRDYIPLNDRFLLLNYFNDGKNFGLLELSNSGQIVQFIPVKGDFFTRFTRRGSIHYVLNNEWFKILAQ